MRRPSFQFYPYDWRNNAKLRRCSPAGRGIWMDALCLMHDSDEYGVLRWPLREIAHALGVSLKLLGELVDKGVMKGGDAFDGIYQHAPTHARKKGDPVTLVQGTGGPCWFSSRLVVDEWRRSVQGASSRFTTGESDSPTQRHGARHGERQGDGATASASTAFASMSTEASTESLEARAERACLLMEKAGCKQCNPAHPDLTAGLAEGVSPEAFGHTAREAVNGNKRSPFAWAIRTARARQADASRPPPGRPSPKPRPATPSPATEPPRPRRTPAAEAPQAFKDLAGQLGIGGKTP